MPRFSRRQEGSSASGDFFGERAILHHDLRNATVTATTQLKCLVLSGDAFDTLDLRHKARRRVRVLGTVFCRIFQGLH